MLFVVLDDVVDRPDGRLLEFVEEGRHHLVRELVHFATSEVSSDVGFGRLLAGDFIEETLAIGVLERVPRHR
jgi:hypothetical protein